MTKKKQVGFVEEGDLYYSYLEFEVIKRMTKNDLYGFVRKWVLSLAMDRANELLQDGHRLGDPKLNVHEEILGKVVEDMGERGGFTPSEAWEVLRRIGFVPAR